MDCTCGSPVYAALSGHTSFGAEKTKEISLPQETKEHIKVKAPAISSENGVVTKSKADSYGVKSDSDYRYDALLEGSLSCRRNEQDYGRWSKPVSNYMVPMDSGYLTVAYDGREVLAEQVDDSFNSISRQHIEMELPMFGGFYAGADAYYLVFGQTNLQEDDSREVVRVVKYDKAWDRISAASLKGANTGVPFDAGSLRMAECNGYLYIRTAHQMYRNPGDGLCHQANMTIQIRESDMSITDANYSVSYIGTGYVSHSFNQFIAIDDEQNLISLDHGDAYPRAAVLCKYRAKAGTGQFSQGCVSTEVFPYEGEIGQNYTGASVGGLSCSASHYLTAGASVKQDRSFEDYETQNIYVTATNRRDFSEEGTDVKWLTSYPEGGSLSASTPQLAKIDENTFLLLWAQMKENEPNGKISYVFLNGKGNPSSQVYTQKGYLSDCQPITKNQKVLWQVIHEGKTTFYTVDARGNMSTAFADFTGGRSIGKAKLIFTKIGPVEMDEDGDFDHEKCVALWDEGAILTEGRAYDMSQWRWSHSANDLLYFSPVLSGIGYYYGQAEPEIEPISKTPQLRSAVSTASGIKLSWEQESGAIGYVLYRKTGNGSYEAVKTIPDRSKTTWTDPNVTKGTEYTYYIKAYTYDGTDYIYTNKSNTKSMANISLAAPAITSAKALKGQKLSIKWKRTSNASGYQIQYAANSRFSGAKTVTVKKGATTDKTITKLKKNKSYFVRVRAYRTFSGNKTYSPWSKSKTVKIKK